jgi:hypothetical protein
MPIPRDHILFHLTGGDRRMVKGVDSACERVRRDPSLFDDLVRGMTHEDELVRMRAADAVEKLTVERPELLSPYASFLLGEVAPIPQQEIRWHVAQLLPRLKLNAMQRHRAVEVLEGYLADRSRLVRTWAMDGIARLSVADPVLKERARKIVDEGLKNGPPSVQARARFLQKLLGKKTV